MLRFVVLIEVLVRAGKFGICSCRIAKEFDRRCL
jgi:hypothetical protein